MMTFMNKREALKAIETICNALEGTGHVIAAVIDDLDGRAYYKPFRKVLRGTVEDSWNTPEGQFTLRMCRTSQSQRSPIQIYVHSQDSTLPHGRNSRFHGFVEKAEEVERFAITVASNDGR